MDFLAYAYLQKAEDQQVLALIDEIGGFKKASPIPVPQLVDRDAGQALNVILAERGYDVARAHLA